MENTGDEIKRLQSCINDLISVLALPAIWVDDLVEYETRLNYVLPRYRDPVI